MHLRLASLKQVQPFWHRPSQRMRSEAHFNINCRSNIILASHAAAKSVPTLLTRRQACAASRHFAFPHFFSPFLPRLSPPTAASSSLCLQRLKGLNAPPPAQRPLPSRLQAPREDNTAAASSKPVTGGAAAQPQMAAANASEPTSDAEAEPDPQFRRQEVDYTGSAAPGTLIVDTPERFLFLVEPNGKALRYGIGVGRPGFEWSGVKRISRKSEWPDWTPPAQMLLRRPTFPPYGGRPRQSARREGALSRVFALPHPRHQRAVDHRPQRVVRLHPDDERGRDRPLRSRPVGAKVIVL